MNESGLARVLRPLFSLILGCALASLVQAAAPVRTLSILTWSDYIDPAVVAAFEADSGIELRFTYFESDEGRDDLLIASGGAGYDLIVTNGYSLRLYEQHGWLAPVTAADVPNLRHMDPRWLSEGPDGARYGVPYFWGTVGIAYRADLVSRPITRWLDLFDPAPELQGRIVMIKNTRDLIGMALRATGHSVNSTDADALADAREILLRQKPHVKAYAYLSLTEESALVSGEVWAAQMYSGDALMLQQHHPDIRFVVPEEGTNLWVDYWAVTARSSNKTAAFQFIDFISRPEQAAQIAAFVHYATPNLAAARLLPEEHHADPVINPPQAVLQRSESYEQLPPRAARAWNALFAEIVN